jgi:4-hydroxy-tetrahydrodipicolinate synthase
MTQDAKSRKPIAAERFAGVIPPLVLPLDRTGQIDFESLDRQIDFLLAGGVHGLWVNGTSGDFFALGDDERARVVAAAVRRAAGRVPVIAQAGDAATRKAIGHGQRALEAGADAIAVVLPYYLDYSQIELKAHYRAVSRGIGVPLFLYQLPQMCKVALSVDSIVELTQDGTLIGIKDSAGDVDFYYRLVRSVRQRELSLRCFYGASSLLDVGLYVGGHGVMSAIANLVPQLCRQAYVDASAGRWGEARAVHGRILDLIEALRLPGRTNWAPTVAIYKWLLCELGVIRHDGVMEPLSPLGNAERDQLRARALPLLKELSGALVARG